MAFSNPILNKYYTQVLEDPWCTNNNILWFVTCDNFIKRCRVEPNLGDREIVNFFKETLANQEDEEEEEDAEDGDTISTVPSVIIVGLLKGQTIKKTKISAKKFNNLLGLLYIRYLCSVELKWPFNTGLILQPFEKDSLPLCKLILDIDIDKNSEYNTGDDGELLSSAVYEEYLGEINKCITNILQLSEHEYRERYANTPVQFCVTAKNTLATRGFHVYYNIYLDTATYFSVVSYLSAALHRVSEECGKEYLKIFVLDTPTGMSLPHVRGHKLITTYDVSKANRTEHIESWEHWKLMSPWFYGPNSDNIHKILSLNIPDFKKPNKLVYRSSKTHMDLAVVPMCPVNAKKLDKFLEYFKFCRPPVWMQSALSVPEDTILYDEFEEIPGKRIKKIFALCQLLQSKNEQGLQQGLLKLTNLRDVDGGGLDCLNEEQKLKVNWQDVEQKIVCTRVYETFKCTTLKKRINSDETTEMMASDNSNDITYEESLHMPSNILEIEKPVHFTQALRFPFSPYQIKLLSEINTNLSNHTIQQKYVELSNKLYTCVLAEYTKNEHNFFYFLNVYIFRLMSKYINKNGVVEYPSSTEGYPPTTNNSASSSSSSIDYSDVEDTIFANNDSSICSPPPARRRRVMTPERPTTTKSSLFKVHLEALPAGRMLTKLIMPTCEFKSINAKKSNMGRGVEQPLSCCVAVMDANSTNQLDNRIDENKMNYNFFFPESNRWFFDMIEEMLTKSGQITPLLGFFINLPNRPQVKDIIFMFLYLFPNLPLHTKYILTRWYEIGYCHGSSVSENPYAASASTNIEDNRSNREKNGENVRALMKSIITGDCLLYSMYQMAFRQYTDEDNGHQYKIRFMREKIEFIDFIKEYINLMSENVFRSFYDYNFISENSKLISMPTMENFLLCSVLGARVFGGGQLLMWNQGARYTVNIDKLTAHFKGYKKFNIPRFTTAGTSPLEFEWIDASVPAIYSVHMRIFECSSPAWSTTLTDTDKKLERDTIQYLHIAELNKLMIEYSQLVPHFLKKIHEQSLLIALLSPLHKHTREIKKETKSFLTYADKDLHTYIPETFLNAFIDDLYPTVGSHITPYTFNNFFMNTLRNGDTKKYIFNYDVPNSNMPPHKMDVWPTNECSNFEKILQNPERYFDFLIVFHWMCTFLFYLQHHGHSWNFHGSTVPYLINSLFSGKDGIIRERNTALSAINSARGEEILNIYGLERAIASIEKNGTVQEVRQLLNKLVQDSTGVKVNDDNVGDDDADGLSSQEPDDELTILNAAQVKNEIAELNVFLQNEYTARCMTTCSESEALLQSVIGSDLYSEKCNENIVRKSNLLKLKRNKIIEINKIISDLPSLFDEDDNRGNNSYSCNNDNNTTTNTTTEHVDDEKKRNPVQENNDCYGIYKLKLQSLDVSEVAAAAAATSVLNNNDNSQVSTENSTLFNSALMSKINTLWKNHNVSSEDRVTKNKTKNASKHTNYSQQQQQQPQPIDNAIFKKFMYDFKFSEYSKLFRDYPNLFVSVLQDDGTTTANEKKCIQLNVLKDPMIVRIAIILCSWIVRLGSKNTFTHTQSTNKIATCAKETMYALLCKRRKLYIQLRKFLSVYFENDELLQLKDPTSATMAFEDFVQKYTVVDDSTTYNKSKSLENNPDPCFDDERSIKSLANNYMSEAEIDYRLNWERSWGMKLCKLYKSNICKLLVGMMSIAEYNYGFFLSLNKLFLSTTFKTNPNRNFFYIYGASGTGKTMMLKVLNALCFTSYDPTTSISQITTNPKQDFDLLAIKCMFLIVILFDEIGSGLNNQRTKAIASSGTISHRAIHDNICVSVPINCKCVGAGNYPFAVDEAMLRRLVPMNKRLKVNVTNYGIHTVTNKYIENNTASLETSLSNFCLMERFVNIKQRESDQIKIKSWCSPIVGEQLINGNLAGCMDISDIATISTYILTAINIFYFNVNSPIDMQLNSWESECKIKYAQSFSHLEKFLSHHVFVASSEHSITGAQLSALVKVWWKEHGNELKITDFSCTTLLSIVEQHLMEYRDEVTGHYKVQCTLRSN